FTFGEGPFRSLKELRKESIIFKKLQRNNPQRAQKIFNKEYIVQVGSYALISPEVKKDINEYVFEMLSHIVTGARIKDKVFGVHFFMPAHHRISKLIKEPNKNGVWEAEIEVLNPSTQKWLVKDKPSTFFPNNWSETTLVNKIHEAFVDRQLESSTKSIGTTKCGVRIVFIFKENKIKTLYPLVD
ncbi:MAG: EndoU domain-containing protein, partial [Chitinophagaceae bacterium]